MKFYSKKTGLFLLSSFLLTACVFLFFGINEIKAAWLGSWSYRKPITITNSGAALANYQVLITLDTQSLIAAGKMRADCGDIRITDSDETTLINYWTDSSCGSTATRIWAKVLSISVGSKTLYVYYGNPTASSIKNGISVFEFFDDFEDGSLDAAKWDSYTATETSGYAHASPANGGNVPRGIFSKQAFPQNSILEYDIQFTGDVGGQGTGWHGFFESWIGGQTAAFTEGCVNPAWSMCITQSNGGSTIINTGADLTARWPYEKITWSTTGSSYFAERSDGWTYANSINVNNPAVNQKILFAANDWDGCCGYADIDLYIYWVGVRKYASPEPALIVGSEEVPCTPSCPGGCADVGQSDGCTGFCPNSAGNSCNDSNVCTSNDVCGGGSCSGINNSNPCDDGSLCTSGDTCSGGSCSGTAVTCSDSNDCTNDSCTPLSGCIFANNSNPCDDGNLCTSGDVCAGGVCNAGTGLACDDSNVCTDDSCAPATGCIFTNNTNPCNDGKTCTSPDICSGGICAGPVNCTAPPGAQCYLSPGFCDASSNCAYAVQPNDTPCDDGEECTTPDLCQNGLCEGGGESCGGLVPCARYTDNPITTDIVESNPCTVCAMFYMLKKIINFVLELTVGIGVFILIVAGLLYAFSAGNTRKIELAKTALNKTIAGIIIVFIAWLLIAVILQAMGYANVGVWNQVNCTL